ncbi:hypothetical protein GCM10010197_20200 [Nocardioides luteus]|uniref:Cell wall anchor protein n=2 Tax=Nocardioides luteus TaxID=1844 RepID=A0ABQ5T1D2_9ACTN|nr:hypothetical protein GCM10010197_20200 [Nocardioides luteus]GLJ69936.1 hypothetical protein GCM10017579_39720 [Nocardioides luteus]
MGWDWRMPFTLSHPAAVLPLLRHPFSVVALVAGAMAPDAPYFARRMPVPVSAQSWYEPFMNATTSHSLVGAVTVSLPYALALTLLCWVAARPLASLVGVDRLGPEPPSGLGTSVARAGWVLLSLLIGVATHLVWDSFTHGDGWVVLHVGLLREPLFGSLTWARALQHVSTVLGLVLIGVHLWRRRDRLRRVRPRSGWPIGVAAGAIGVGAVAGTYRLWGEAGLSPRDLVEGVLSGAATGGGAALVGVLVLLVIGWWAAYGVRTLRARRRLS